jgi:MerR HTH family regulatory protein
MTYLATADVCRLTGLSTEKLREWTSRRSLIPADIPSKQQGSPARYSWATVLVLRLAVVMREHFNVELKANSELFAELRRELARRPFLSLHSQSLALLGRGNWALVADNEVPPADSLLIRLDHHLAAIAAGFPQRELAGAGPQRDLFPLSRVASMSRKVAHESSSKPPAVRMMRRSSV